MRRNRTRTSLLVTACVVVATLAAPVRAAPDSVFAPVGSHSANGRIAYIDLGDNNSSFDVFTVRRDGSGVRRLTSTGDAFSPAWSPDGRRIAFERNRVEAGTQLWVTGPRGRHKRLLLSGLDGGRFPSWSPDGLRIVFAADAARGTRQLFVYDLRADAVTRLTNPGRRRWSADEPAWSPRGDRIAFFRYNRRTGPELSTIRTDGTALRRLTRTAFSEFDPDWSPDGARIAYTRSWHEQPCRSDVYVVAADGGRPRKVLDRGCDDSDPSWAPNGARIVLYSNRPQGTPGWRRESGLWTVRPDGSGARLLVQGLFAGAPDWQPR